jgi:hypothetical protein
MWSLSKLGPSGIISAYYPICTRIAIAEVLAGIFLLEYIGIFGAEGDLIIWQERLG